MKKNIRKSLLVRMLAAALAASLAFPGTAFAAALDAVGQDEADQIVQEQEDFISSETESSESEEDALSSENSAVSDLEIGGSQQYDDGSDIKDQEEEEDQKGAYGSDDDLTEGQDGQDAVFDDPSAQEGSQENEAASDENAQTGQNNDEEKEDDGKALLEDETETAAGSETEEILTDDMSSNEEGQDEEDNEETDASEPAAAGVNLNPIENLWFSSSYYEIDPDDSTTVQLDVEVTYEDDAEQVYDGNQPYYFRSGDEKVVTVSEDGIVTAVGAGETKVYVYTGTYGSADYSEWDYAYFTVLSPTRTVLFDLNGGSWSDSSSEAEYSTGLSGRDGDYVYLPSSYDVSRTGYNFLGWTTTKNGTDYASDYWGGSYEISGDVTLYAKWAKLICVKLDLNDGTWDDSSSYYATMFKNGYYGEKGDYVYLPSSSYVSRAGYKFLGWTTTKNGTKYVSDAWGDSYTLSADVTLYAKWAKLYTVKFDLNGGKWSSSDSYYKNGLSDVKNATVYLPDDYDVTRSDYIFKGWTTTKNGTNYVSNAGSSRYTITKDITVYAKWAKAVKITLNAGKGYFGHDKNSKKIVIQEEKGSTVGSSIYYELYNSDYYTPKDGTSSFEGWYKDAKLTKPVKRSDVLSANTTFYAKWQAKTYKITVTNLKGASYENRATGEYTNSENSKAASYSFYIARGDEIGYLYAWKNGKECKFYFDKACTQKPFYSSYIPTANTTVYAKFLDEVTISWDANGGATSYGSTKGTYNCTKNLMWESRPKVTRDGYYFVGWVDAAKPSVVLPASHVFTKNTTVKAKWAKAVKVTFNPAGGKWSTEDTKSTNKVTYTRAKAELRKYASIPGTPVKTGYTFMGWKSSLTKKKVADIYSDKPAKAVTYTAIWSKNTVKVTLMAAEGSLYDSESRKYVTKVTVQVPKNAKLSDVSLKYDNHDEPSKRLDFDGWSLKKNGKALAGTYKFTKAVTLYPVWSKEPGLRVVLITNGGAIDGYPDNDPDVWHVKKGDVISLPTGSRIEREGYTLVGWYTDYKCTKKVSSPAKYKVTKTCYLYAKWKKK